MGDYNFTLQAGATETIAIDGTVKSLTADKYKPATGPYAGREAFEAFISIETKAVRFTLDGTPPVIGGAGHPLAAGDTLTLKGFTNLKRAKFTEGAAGQAATIQATYFF